MRRVCQECKRVFGFKEPFEDDSETHGICDECFPMVLKKFEQTMREATIKNGQVQMGTEDTKD